MHKNLLAVLLSTTVSSTCMYGAQMASTESYQGDFTHTRTHYHMRRVNSVAWSPDGQRLVSGSNDKTVKLWGPNRNDIKTFKKHHHWVTSAAWSPNGKYVISGSLDNTIKVWSPSSNTYVQFDQGSPRGITSVAVGCNGRIASTADDSQLWIWSEQNKTFKCDVLRSLSVMATLCAVTFSPDGTQLSSGSFVPEFWIWDCEKGKPIRQAKGHKAGVTSVKWAQNGRLLASASQDRTIKIWDMKQGKPVHRLKGHADRINSVAWSPDGQRLVSGSDDKTAMVWDCRNCKVVQALQGHNGSINSVDWSVGEEKIVTGSSDGEIFIWEESQPSNRVYSPPVTREKTILTPIEEEPEIEATLPVVPNQSQTGTPLSTRSSLPMSSQKEEQESHRRWSKNLFSFLSCIWSCRRLND